MSDLNVEELRRKNQATVEKFFHSNFAEQMELFTDDGSFEPRLYRASDEERGQSCPEGTCKKYG